MVMVMVVMVCSGDYSVSSKAPTHNNPSPLATLHSFDRADWALTLYAKALPLDVASRIWDAYVLDGDALFFRAAVGLLSYLAPRLLGLDFEGARWRNLRGGFFFPLMPSFDP